MLLKILCYTLLIASQTCGSNGAINDQQASSILPNFSDLGSLNAMNNFAQPTISHKSFIEHGSPRSGGSSQSTGTRSSSLLNKAIAQHGAGPDPAMSSSIYTNNQMASPYNSNGPLGIPSINYATNGILSPGVLGASIDNVIGSAPGIISLNIDHSTPGSHSSASPSGKSLLNINNGRISSPGFIITPSDKINVPASEMISVSVSSSSDDNTRINTPEVEVPFGNYGNNGVLSIGPFGASFGKDVISIPNAVSINSVGEHRPSVRISAATSDVAAPIKVSSSVGPAESSFFSSLGPVTENPSAALQYGTSLGKDIVPIPNTITTNSAPVLETPASISAVSGVAAVPVKASSSIGLAESSFYSSLGTITENPSLVGQLETSLVKDITSIPNTMSTNSVPVLESPASISAAVPVKVSSSAGPAESSFFSSLGSIVEKQSTLSGPTSITLQNNAATSNESPSVNYNAENFFPSLAIDHAPSSNPITLTSQTSSNSYLPTPASDISGLLGNGYNNNPSAILSSGFLGSPISSIWGVSGKALSPNGQFSVSNIINNENLGVGIANSPIFGNTNDPLTVIQQTVPTNAAAPIPFSGLNNNNFFNGLDRNDIFADPIGFANGIFGNTYNGMNGFGGGNFASNDIFSKYLWR